MAHLRSSRLLRFAIALTIALAVALISRFARVGDVHPAPAPVPAQHR